MTRPKKVRFIDAPMAVASDGSLLISASHALGMDDLRELLAAIPKDAAVFVGVVVPRQYQRQVLRRIDDAAAEIAGTTRLSEIGLAASASARPSGQRSRGPSRDRLDVRARRR